MPLPGCTMPGGAEPCKAYTELREMLIEARDKGLIYWEPNTSRGHISKAEMLAKIQHVLQDN